MNNGNKRREIKRQKSSRTVKIRYDRIVAAILVLVVIIVVFASCAKSCSSTNKKSSDTSDNTAPSEEDSSSSSSSSPTIVDNLETSVDRSETSDSKNTDKSTDVPATSPQFALETHATNDIYSGDLVLVNSDHEYKFSDGEANIVTLYDHINTEYYSVSDYIMRLDTNTLNQLNALMKGFNEATKNTDVTVIGAYRTLEEQNDRYESGSSGFKGGYSDYHTARSFDLAVFPQDASSGYYSPTGEYAWIDEHAADYGFIVRFPDGKEQFTGEVGRTQTYRYVGVPHAAYMKQNDLCLEEYIDMLKAHTKDDPIEFSTNGKSYQIYYAAAGAGSDSDIPVPTNKVYEISGNNCDGFIITVCLD